MEAVRHGTLTEAAVDVVEVPCCKRKGPGFLKRKKTKEKKIRKSKPIHCVPDLQNTAIIKSKTKQK